MRRQETERQSDEKLETRQDASMLPDPETNAKKVTPERAWSDEVEQETRLLRSLSYLS